MLAMLSVLDGEFVLVIGIGPPAGGFRVRPALFGLGLLQEGGEGTTVEQAVEDIIRIVAHGRRLLRWPA